MDLDFKVEKVNALSKELEEAEAVGGIRGSEEEFSSLKRQKHELELKSKDQEEELDDLAGQVQMLELAKTKLEMDLAAGKRHISTWSSSTFSVLCDYNCVILWFFCSEKGAPTRVV